VSIALSRDFVSPRSSTSITIFNRPRPHSPSPNAIYPTLKTFVPASGPAGSRMTAPVTTHAVARLRAARLARSSKPFLARGGPKGERCAGCRLPPSHCLCALRPAVPTRAGICLVMADIEPLKPSNTGWLIADVVADTWAFGWARTEVDPTLLALLADPQWQPYVVFPGEYVAAKRVVTDLVDKPQGTAPGNMSGGAGEAAADTAQSKKKPLFILLDATWSEARKIFRKSPYLDQFPVLSLQTGQLSRYRLRRSTRDDHLCTSEVAAACLALAGEPHAADVLAAWLEVFTIHYLNAKQQVPVDGDDAAHVRLRGLAGLG
jgi:DTW domain-containing protein